MKKKFYLVASLLLASTTLVAMTSCSPTSENSQVTGEAKINVSGPTEVEVGKTINLRINVQNDASKQGYKTESSNTSIATVNQNKVTGVKEGTCKIIVSLVGDPNVKKEYSITVKKAFDMSGIEVNITGATTTTMKVNSTVTLTAEVTGAGEQTVSYRWESTNKLSEITNGREKTCTVKAIEAGSETITVTVSVGSSSIKKTINLTYEEDYSSYIEIATKDDFMSKIINAPSPNLDKKYYLSADIDLGGEKIDGFAKKLNLSGTLDGRGHTLSNYEVISTDTSDPNAGGANSGLIQSVSSTGKIKNLHVVGTIRQQGAGWGTATLVNVHSGTIENCLVETKQEYNQGSDQWFPFNGSICGVLKEESVVRNCVVNVTSTCEATGVNMAIAAYPAGGSEGLSAKSDQTFKVTNVYTNQPKASTLGSVWDWGSPIEDDSSIYCSINFTNAAKATYSGLDENIWDLKDNQMPQLKEMK